MAKTRPLMISFNQYSGRKKNPNKIQQWMEQVFNEIDLMFESVYNISQGLIFS